MKYIVRGAFWVSSYVFLILFPLIIGAVARPAGRGQGFWVELAIACGYVGLAIMAFEFALMSRVQSAAAPFGEDALQQFHTQMGYVATLFVLAHPTLLFLKGLPLTMLNPFSDKHRWVWRSGAIGFWGLLMLIFLSAFRRRLKIPYEWWHLTHALIASLAVLCALIHVYMVGNDSASKAMRVLWAFYVLVLFGLAVRYRIVRPLTIWRRPWEVVENIKEHGNARTLILRPIDHDGFTFEPGQFAWLNMGKTPFHFEQHPISISTSAENGWNGEIGFTIKALGDWSDSVVPAMKPGTRMWIDGPHGVFSADREQGPGYVLIGGGIGITPLHSMCETLAMREDKRPVLLFYGSRDYDDLTFREEFEELSKKMTLKVIYVLENPGAGWTGEKGYVAADVLRRHLPRQYKRFQYFICGPTPLMDTMERVLPEIGVPPEFVHTERFDMV